MRPLRRFLYVLLCLTVYVICLWVFFPHKQSPCNLLSKDDYMGYLHYETSDFYEKYDAKSILIKDISFNFDMEVPIDFTSISYDFMIIRQGVIYKGPFKENITVKDVPFIMDNNLTRANTVAFILLDHTNKQVYNINGIMTTLISYIKKTNTTLLFKRTENFCLAIPRSSDGFRG